MASTTSWPIAGLCTSAPPRTPPPSPARTLNAGGARKAKRAIRTRALLLILADGGGSNGNRVRAFKYWLQHHLCDTHCLVVTVAHYPAGASKWNPIEHRLFSEISKNWAGRPLDRLETLLAYAASTRTASGLEVTAQQVEGQFETGEKISKAQMKALDLEPHQVQPNRNYTLYPRL
ncbi:MAG: hypothetical protein GEU90_22100 [Gemmatimonas sp.]|nr:hypothetical protein [Gemmatimonas sp.]